MNTEITIALIGVATTVISNLITWFFTRKKYNVEVDNSIIEGMKSSLDFYQKLSTDNKERLEEVLKRNELLEEEVADLRKQLLNLMGSICVDLSCQIRKRDLTLVNQDGIKTSKKD